MRLGALGRENGTGPLLVTRAGLLMFGHEHEIVREFPSHFLDYRERLAPEPGDERWSDRVVSNVDERTGNPFGFWQVVSARITRDLRRPFATDADQLRVDDTPMHRALREALVNALIHADYYGTRPVVITSFPDRVEASNPGDLRVPAEVALRDGISDARNPTLMKMFSLIAACERAGSGLDAIRTACAATNARDVELHDSHEPPQTRLTVYLGSASALTPTAASIAPDTATAQTETDEERVIALLARVGRARRTAVQAELGYGCTKTKRILSTMVSAGLIETTGSGNQVAYRLPREQ